MISFSFTLFLKYEGGLLYQWGIVGTQADNSIVEILHNGKVYTELFGLNAKIHPEL